SAMSLAERCSEIGEIDELVGILMRIVEPAHDQVRTGADIGRNRRLGTDILPAFLVDADLYAGCLGESLGVGVPGILLAFYERHPAQEPKARAFFRRESRDAVLSEGLSYAELAAQSGCGGQAGSPCN